MSQNEKLVKFLSTGRSLTTAQARTRFGVRNLRARVNDLRSEGHCVYTNYTKGVAQYRIGTPSRSMVEIAFRIAGTRVFGVKN